MKAASADAMLGMLLSTLPTTIKAYTIAPTAKLLATSSPTRQAIPIAPVATVTALPAKCHPVFLFCMRTPRPIVSLQGATTTHATKAVRADTILGMLLNTLLTTTIKAYAIAPLAKATSSLPTTPATPIAPAVTPTAVPAAAGVSFPPCLTTLSILAPSATVNAACSSTTSPAHSVGAPIDCAKCDAVLPVTLLGMNARAQSAAHATT